MPRPAGRLHHQSSDERHAVRTAVADLQFRDHQRGGFTISGNNTTRIFMVGVDSATQTSGAVVGSIIAQRQQVVISNVALSS
jgi:hypothetical protein